MILLAPIEVGAPAGLSLGWVAEGSRLERVVSAKEVQITRELGLSKARHEPGPATMDIEQGRGPEDTADAAERVFEALRDEVAAQRRALERLAACWHRDGRRTSRPRDYSPTLGRMAPDLRRSTSGSTASRHNRRCG